MHPRPPTRRILFLRPFRPPNVIRPFTQNILQPRARPQLPFLSSRSTARRPVARFLTTETKEWIKSEVKLAVKLTVVGWTIVGLGLVMYFGVLQEWLERKFPTPAEWSWYSRKHFRSVRYAEEPDDEDDIVDWATVGSAYRVILMRLEDPKIDGADLVEQAEGGILVAGIGKTGYDITQKSEPWRRGYYQALMGAGRSAEHLDECVTDRKRMIVFPKNVVIGPSNPNPRPVPPGAYPAPNEEDCDPTGQPPEVYYMRILTTNGFNEKQKVDAALAYGAWLDYKKTPQAALEMYKWALDIATAGDSTMIDTTTGILNTSSGIPSANILAATTALAVHHAANSNLNTALPMFLSILRARKSLPPPTITMHSKLNPDDDENSLWQVTSRILKSLMVAPVYPPPPSDGTSPPQRSAQERCEEAGIMSYIGEILYASKTSKTSKEDGLAWTREAVDIAEVELRARAVGKEAKETCRQCLQVGLTNWRMMVSKLAKEERAAKAAGGKRGSWLGFGGEQEEVVGRWESEELVVKERMMRARAIVGPAGF